MGDNAVVYAQTICEEPYYAGDTEAFAAYKEIIGGLLENATPAMTELPETPNKMEGEYSFQADSEYIMVIEFLQESGYRTQLSPLAATWIGEAEELPEGNGGKTEPFNWGYLIPVVAAVVIAGGAVVVVVATRKKKEE